MIANEWVQLAALISTLIGGLAAIWFFWEKIFAGIKWITRKVKNLLIRNPHPNPFGDVGRIDNPERFFGRTELLRQIFEELQKGTNLSLIGETQIGKSSLLSKVREMGSIKMPDKTFVYLNMSNVHDEGDFFKALCSEIDIPECRGSELDRALRNKRYVLCIDEIERMTNHGFSGDERTELRGLAETANSPLSLLIASRSPLSTLFPNDSSALNPSPLDGICQQLRVPPFSQEEVHTLITTRLQPTGLQFNDVEIEKILQDTQGHPARVQQAAAELYQQKINNTLK